MTIRAQFIQEMTDFQRDRVRLAMREESYRGYRYLLADGTWSEWADPENRAGEKLELEIGISLPSASLEALATALDEFRGTATHAPTAERILRESLDVERRRVDAALERGQEIVYVDPTGRIHPDAAADHR